MMICGKWSDIINKLGGFIMKKKKMYYLSRDVVAAINQEMRYFQITLHDSMETMKAQEEADRERMLLELKACSLKQRKRINRK